MTCDNLFCIYLGYDLNFSIMITNIYINNTACFNKRRIILLNYFAIILTYFERETFFYECLYVLIPYMILVNVIYWGGHLYMSLVCQVGVIHVWHNSLKVLIFLSVLCYLFDEIQKGGEVYGKLFMICHSKLY